MNPYLENPRRWRMVHNGLIYGFTAAVVERLPRGFSASTEERAYKDSSGAVRERFIEIRTMDEREELIAVVEFLSPTNKASGPGRDEYRSKQRDLLASGVHLLEIDLLRGGEYTLAPPESRTRAYLGAFDYLVSLHRGDTQARFDVWAVKLRDRLPEVTIPLTDEVPPVVVSLQAVVNRVYHEGGHARLIRYEEEPIPPLLPEDAAWADALLKEAGLRG